MIFGVTQVYIAHKPVLDRIIRKFFESTIALQQARSLNEEIVWEATYVGGGSVECAYDLLSHKALTGSMRYAYTCTDSDE